MTRRYFCEEAPEWKILRQGGIEGTEQKNISREADHGRDFRATAFFDGSFAWR
jgi:hypothetical protein